MATATPTAVKKLTIPIPLSLSAALLCVAEKMGPEVVLVGPEEEEEVGVSVAEIVESNELSREPVIDAVSVPEAAVPVSDADADAASDPVEDMLGSGLCRLDELGGTPRGGNDVSRDQSVEYCRGCLEKLV